MMVAMIGFASIVYVGVACCVAVVVGSGITDGILGLWCCGVCRQRWCCWWWV